MRPQSDSFKQRVRGGFHDVAEVITNNISWDRAVVARKAHNLEVGGSNPSPATNISRGGLELVPAWSHKPNHVGSNPTPATKDEFPHTFRLVAS